MTTTAQTPTASYQTLPANADESAVHAIRQALSTLPRSSARRRTLTVTVMARA